MFISFGTLPSQQFLAFVLVMAGKDHSAYAGTLASGRMSALPATTKE